MKSQVLKSLLIITFFLSIGNVFAQQKTNIGFSYQAVARDPQGLALSNKSIVVEISIRKGSKTGSTLWQETHSVKTNQFGLFSVVIGRGNTTGVGKLDSFNDIDWSQKDIYTGVRADFGNGLLPMGNVQLQAVPYAYIADSALTSPRFNLKELLDVNTSSIQKNDILRWDGKEWNSVNFDNTINALYTKYKQDSLKSNTNLVNIYTELKAKAVSDSTLLKGQINSTNSDLTSEVTRAKKSETTLITDLASEITNRKAGDNDIKTKVVSDSTVLKGFIDGKADRTLSNLSNVSTARTNLQLGTIATQDASIIVVTGGTINGTSIGASSPSTGKFTTLSTSGQVGIGTNTPDASAALEVNSTTGGLLLPRLTTAQRDLLKPSTSGLLIFNTDLNKFQGNIISSGVPSTQNVNTNFAYGNHVNINVTESNYLACGQSFTSSESSKLSSFTFYSKESHSSQNVIVSVYSGSGISGNLLFRKEFTVNLVENTEFLLDVSSENLSIVSGNEYTVLLSTNGSDFLIGMSSSDQNPGNMYSGQLNYDYTAKQFFTYTSYDLYLKVGYVSSSNQWVDLH